MPEQIAAMASRPFGGGGARAARAGYRRRTSRRRRRRDHDQWLVATWVTKPVDRDVLHRFDRHVRLAGPGWADSANASGGV